MKICISYFLFDSIEFSVYSIYIFYLFYRIEFKDTSKYFEVVGA